MIRPPREDVLRTHSASTDSAPLVSIGMPAFNCERTLPVAIRSILNQTYGNWELLLLEDGSSDRTLEVAGSFFDRRISVFSDQSHKGLVHRLNQAVALSRGRYFARMDADDVAYPGRFERQVAYLEQHTEIDLLGCAMLVFKGDGVVLGWRSFPETPEEICRRPSQGFPIGHPTWMGRTEWFRAHPYDARTVRAEDQVLLLRSHRNSSFACLPEILCGYREDKLVLRKILRGRYTFAMAAFQECAECSGYIGALRSLPSHCAKAFLEILAVATGLTYVALPHRARSLDSAGLERWAEVWCEVQGPPNSQIPEGVLTSF